MASEQCQIHIVFLPFMAPGHLIPGMDMARLLARRGIKSTIVTTSANLNFIAEMVNLDNQKLGIGIELLEMKFPYEEVGLPVGCENADSISSPEMLPKFYKAVELLQYPFEKIMIKINPNCIIADYFFSWANSVAKKFSVPCMAFHGSSYFSQCVMSALLQYEPHKKVTSDTENFVVPGLPHEIMLTKSMLSPTETREGPKSHMEMMDKMRELIRECDGVIMNSFYELESAYADYYAKVLGMKHWHIGPFSCSFDINEANSRGKRCSIDARQCLRWLDEKELNSVIYVCFGSISGISEAQLSEITSALEALGCNFVLVIRKDDSKGSILDALEARVKVQGLVIRGWAPQVLILNHQSVGCFVTHCGWNSVLEGVNTGVPMVTWPLFAEQFYNEKLVTSVLKIGIEVGAKKWQQSIGGENTLIDKEEILKALKRVMIGHEAEEMRKRVKEFKEMARQATSAGGSSNSDLSALISELKSYKK